MTLAEIKAEVMDHWMQNYRKTAMAQPKDWLDAQAEAMAQSIKDQIKLELIPGWNSEAELYSEAARTHLRPPPVKKAA